LFFPRTNLVSRVVTIQRSRGPHPRILHVTRNLPPLLGGMERLNRQLAIAMSAVATVDVIGPLGARAHLPGSIGVVEVPPAPLAAFLTRAGLAAWTAARRPADVVLAGSGLTTPHALLAARRAGGRAGAYVHGLDLVVRNPMYQALWLPALRRLDFAWANSRNTARLAQQAGVAGGRIRVIHPAVDATVVDPVAAREVRQRLALGDGPLLVSVGRLTRRKGLAGFVRDVLPRVRAAHPAATLLVVGDDAPYALAGRGDHLRGEIEALASAAGAAQAIRFLGPRRDAELAAILASADVHVFPVIEVPGDVEGFGMVAIEAAAQGLATVAYSVGGIPDAVIEPDTGRLCAPGDASAFADAVIAAIDAAADADRRQRCIAAAARFGIDRFDAEVHAALAEVLESRR
jgi:phosphatidylinositol alpha-1,6-mannosyltransferase